MMKSSAFLRRFSREIKKIYLYTNLSAWCWKCWHCGICTMVFTSC